MECSNFVSLVERIIFSASSKNFSQSSTALQLLAWCLLDTSPTPVDPLWTFWWWGWIPWVAWEPDSMQPDINNEIYQFLLSLWHILEGQWPQGLCHAHASWQYHPISTLSLTKKYTIYPFPTSSNSSNMSSNLQHLLKATGNHALLMKKPGPCTSISSHNITSWCSSVCQYLHHFSLIQWV